MPVNCINKNSVEYQSLKNRADIPEYILESVCRGFLDRYGRFPHLDELPNSNSELAFRKLFGIKQNGEVKISTILENTGLSDIESSNATINDKFRDLEVKIIPIDEDAIVEVTHRPVENNFDINPIELDTNINNRLILSNAIHKLGTLYGISFNEITDSELNSDKWKDIIPDGNLVNAFIYNGQIYINIDRANLDAPIHEMFHIFIGSIRFSDPKLYSELVQLVEQFPNYEKLIQEYPNRTRNDVNEEIFVTEASKYLLNISSNLDNLPENVRYELNYNIKRVLDTVLMGQDSVKIIPEQLLYNLSLKDVANMVNSSVMINLFHGTLDVSLSEMHRKLNNTKSDLFRKNELIEQCE